MHRWLGTDWQSQLVTWLITKPLAILVLGVAAVALRWFLHRLIDRLVRRAAEGLPSPVLRRRRDDAAGEAAEGSFEEAVDGPDRQLVQPPASGIAGRRVQRAQTMGSL